MARPRKLYIEQLVSAAAGFACHSPFPALIGCQGNTLEKRCIFCVLAYI